MNGAKFLGMCLITIAYCAWMTTFDSRVDYAIMDDDRRYAKRVDIVKVAFTGIWLAGMVLIGLAA